MRKLIVASAGAVLAFAAASSTGTLTPQLAAVHAVAETDPGPAAFTGQ
jgi:hypothetical protein